MTCPGAPVIRSSRARKIFSPSQNEVLTTGKYSQHFISILSRIYKVHRPPHSMVVPGSLWIREASTSPPQEPDGLLESQEHIEGKGLSQAERMSRPSGAPRLTPQYCFNERALRGQCFFSDPKSSPNPD